MNNIFNLTKIYMLESIGSLFSKIKKRGLGIKSVLSKLLFGFLFLLFGFNMGVLFFGYGQTLNSIGLENYVLYYGIIYFNLLCLLFLSYQTQDLFFKTKDFEMLSSLPIKSYQIIISKLLSLLLICYTFELLVVVPALIVYCIFVPISFLSVLFFVLLMFFLPMLNIFYSSIIVFVINKISSKTQNKETVNMFLIFGFMFIVTGVFLFVNYWGLGSLISSGGIPKIMHYLFSTSTLMFWAIDKSSLVMLIFDILSSLALFVLSTILLSHAYFSINHDYQNKKIKLKQKMEYNQSGVLKKLIFVEFKNFVNKPVYVFNTTFGMILLLIVSLALPVYFFLNTEMFLSVSSPFASFLTKDYLILIFAFAPASLTFMSSTTNSSVSLEGQAIYFKKSLPIHFQNIAISKIAINLMIGSPILLFFVTSLPIMIVLGMGFLDILLCFLIPVITLLFVSLFGLMVNLWFPLLNWSNVTIVVKQSTSSMISILGGFGIAIGVFTLYFLLEFSAIIFSLIYLILMIFICCSLWWIICTKGKQIYQKI